MSALYDNYVSWRKSFNLPQPGPFEMLHKEIRGVFTNQFMFDGAKLDFASHLSQNFQLSQSFSLGSQVQPQMYSLGGTFGGQNGFLMANIDTEGQLSGRGAYSLTRGLSAKFQGQLGMMPGQAVLNLELDYSGFDYSLNLKAVNPSIGDATGVYVAQYLQSLSKSVAVGVEVAHQRPSPGMSETPLTFVMKYQRPQWVLTTNLSQIGVLQTSYVHKVSDKIELGAELQYIAAQNRREAVCTTGLKWEMMHASFRGQVDSTGRVSAVVEERVAPGVSLLFSGEIDHVKTQSKFGIGLHLEN